MKKRYTKIVSLILRFGLAASMIARCSVKSSEDVVTTAAPTAAKAETTASAKSGGSVTGQKKMVLWDKSKYVEDYNIVMKAKIDEFTNENHVNVDYVVIPVADVKQRLMAAIGAGNAPDLTVGGDMPVGQFISMQQIAECSDVFEAVDLTENSKILGTFNGKSYPVSLVLTAPGMYLRTDQWEKIGMDIPTTWEELKKGVKLMDDLVNDFYGLGFVMGASGGGDAEGFCKTIILGWEGIPVDRNGKITVNSPETLEALKFIASLYEEGLIPPDATTGDDSRSNNAYLAGTVGVITNSGSVVPSMKEEKPDLLANTQIIAYPAGSTGGAFTLGGTSVFGISGTGKNTETAKRFAKYYFEGLDNYNAMIGAIGTIQQLVVSRVDNTNFWKNPVNVGWLTNSKNTYKTYYPALSDKRVTVSLTSQFCVKAVQGIAVDKVDPQEVLDHLEAEFNGIYS